MLTSDILEEAGQLLNQIPERKESVGVLTIKSGNQWLEEASKRPIPEDLFHKLWFQSELCILFADTNLGKSIFAVQIAIKIADSRVVLYIDFELSDKQFEGRYSDNYSSHFRFPVGFHRAEMNADAADYKACGFNSIEDYLAFSIEKAIEETGATVLIIDNLTYLRTETEKAKDALPLMKHLKQLKTKHGLSILCLAHTPKRDLSKPITRNDLSGSKMLINFCDSAFAIGESTKDSSLRYVKQIKVRNTEFVYDSENVAVYRITKPHNFLHFEYLGYSSEKEHLKQLTEKDKQNINQQIIDMMSAGHSNRHTAEALNVNHMRVFRVWKEHSEKNKSVTECNEA
jgi:RecA-family ATPase